MPEEVYAALTLVELLVVVTIIGLLVALLPPAIQAAREMAQRAQCGSNIRQIALRRHAYARRTRSPMGGVGGPNGGGPYSGTTASGTGSFNGTPVKGACFGYSISAPPDQSHGSTTFATTHWMRDILPYMDLSGIPPSSCIIGVAGTHTSYIVDIKTYVPNLYSKDPVSGSVTLGPSSVNVKAFYCPSRRSSEISQGEGR